MKGGRVSYILVIGGLVLVIIALTILNINLSKNKKGFTELYFVGDLPKQAELNEEHVFSFGISNLENKRTEYSYEVYVDSTKIDQGFISLENEKKVTLSQKFKISRRTEESVHVSVKLLNKNQEIHFWVEVK